MTRPISVTVVAWVIVAIEFEALIGVFSGLAAPIFKTSHFSTLPLSVLIWITLFSASFCIAFAFFMLKGADWARITYLGLKGLGILGMLAGFLHGTTNPVIFISVTAKFALFAFFLFRADANAYFRSAVPMVISRIDEPSRG